MSCPSSEGQTPQPSCSLVLCSPCASSVPRWCFSFSPSTSDGRGNFKELLTFVISWGSLQGFHSPDTFLFFLFPSFFFYITAWVEPYIFWAWPFSIWDTSCQLLIFIVVCWLCCIVSECSSIMEWIISLFDFINLIFILFYFECHMVGFFCLLQLTFLFEGTTSIHPYIPLTFFNSTCDFYGFIFCLPLILHSFFIVTSMREIRPGESYTWFGIK